MEYVWLSCQMEMERRGERERERERKRKLSRALVTREEAESALPEDSNRSK